MTGPGPAQVAAALRAGASGVHPLEAGVGLLIDCGMWLDRRDFTSRFITITARDGGALLASADWQAAIAGLDAGQLPSSGGEKRILRLAASLAGGVPVSLWHALPGIDHRNADLVVTAVAHATGYRRQR